MTELKIAADVISAENDKRASALKSDYAALGENLSRRGVDIEHHQFVGFLLVEDLHRIDRIAHIFGVLETLGLDQATVADKQAWDNAGA